MSVISNKTPYGTDRSIHAGPVGAFYRHSEWERGIGIRLGGWRKRANRFLAIEVKRRWNG